MSLAQFTFNTKGSVKLYSFNFIIGTKKFGSGYLVYGTTNLK